MEDCTHHFAKAKRNVQMKCTNRSVDIIADTPCKIALIAVPRFLSKHMHCRLLIQRWMQKALTKVSFLAFLFHVEFLRLRGKLRVYLIESRLHAICDISTIISYPEFHVVKNEAGKI